MTTRPHIVGIVGNDIVSDSRVKKVAESAARAGFRSTIICYAPTGEEHRSRMGDVDVIRLPVPFSAMNAPGRVAQPVRPVVATELVDRHLGPRTVQLAKKRRLEALDADEGRSMPSLRLRLLQARIWMRRFLFRLRRRGHIKFDRAIRRFNLARRRISLRLLKPLRNPVANVYDYELAFGPEIESLEPDVIHAHDFHMIGVAVTAARRLRARGVRTKVLYDAHELVEGLSYSDDIIAGWLAEEGEFIHHVDAVTGVSAEQAERIVERYGLKELPTVILNAPLDDVSETPSRSMRNGINREASILVYHGNVALERGVFTLIEALAHMDSSVHAVFVAPPESPLEPAMIEHACEIGVDDRVHVVPFVPSSQLKRFLEEGTIAVIPYLRTGNNDIALPNKLFEAIQANLPVLTSDMRALSRFVEEAEIGLVFRSGDPVDLASKASSMIEDLNRFKAHLTEDLAKRASWDTQAERLAKVYGRLTGSKVPEQIHIRSTDVYEPPREASWGDYRPTRLAVGPRNMAGQAFLMARAVGTHLGVPAVSFSMEKAAYAFPVDKTITSEAWNDPAWHTHQIRLITSTFTHVLAESGTGILGALNGGFVDEQLPLLDKANVKVGVLLHGSEIRDPAHHRALPFSPYAESDQLIGQLEKSVHRLKQHLEGVDLPFFVTTPDLIEYVDAKWLPVVIDVEHWASITEPFREEIPTVLHMPTNGLLKGSKYIDPVLEQLQAEGLIQYERPTEAMTADEVRKAIETADVVVDGIVLGAYGVMSCQAMAAGRIAVAGLGQLGPLRAEVPIVDANPDDLEEKLRELISDRRSWEDRGRAGREFVEKYHDGTYSAHQLAEFLGVTLEPWS